MLYGGINILKEESRIVIIGDDNKLYIFLNYVNC